jgi:hypothetical protein
MGNFNILSLGRDRNTVDRENIIYCSVHGEKKQKQKKKKQRSFRGNGLLLETLPNLTEYTEIYNVEADR